MTDVEEQLAECRAKLARFEDAADDAHLSCIAAQEELTLARKNNLANCLQITALQEKLMRYEAAALIGLLAGRPNSDCGVEGYCHDAHLFADEMLAEREKK